MSSTNHTPAHVPQQQQRNDHNADVKARQAQDSTGLE